MNIVEYCQVKAVKLFGLEPMECSSLVSIAAFGPGDPGSNPG